MKRIIILFVLMLCSGQSLAQRYLTPIFEETVTTSDIAYGSSTNYLGETQDLVLDFYEPENDTLQQRPLLIYVHGGGFTDVTQSKNLIHIVAYCDSMARRGYAVSAMNYRLDESISNRAVINAMHDAKAAIRFFRSNAATYKIDPELIFIGGESAGAVTSMTSTYIDEPEEVLYPPTTPMASDLTVEGNSGNSGFSSNTTAAMCLCGGTETIFGDLLFDTLAIQEATDPPILITHGTEDNFIHVSKALEVAIRANNIQLPYLFYSYPGATHCPWFYPLENSWQYLDTMITQSTTFLHSIIDFYTNVEEVALDEMNLSVYPNPTSNYAIVDLNILSGKLEELVLFDFTGRQYVVPFTKEGSSKIEINLQNMESGSYIGQLKYKDGRTIYTSPILKLDK